MFYFNGTDNTLDLKNKLDFKFVLVLNKYIS